MKIEETSTSIVTETRNIFADNGILSVYPNPVLNELNINYTLQNKSTSKISIYDVMGKLIFEDNNGLNQAGNYSYKWNRMSNGNTKVSSGTYILKVSADGKSATKILVLN
jgi:flagellar hook assembly protein FlgD